MKKTVCQTNREGLAKERQQHLDDLISQLEGLEILYDYGHRTGKELDTEYM